MRMFLACTIAISILSGCRFVAPSSSDNAALERSGAFDSGTPTWARTNNKARTSLPAKGGIIPQTLTTPESVSLSSSANASSSTEANLGRAIEDPRKKRSKKNASKVLAPKIQEEDTPNNLIDRVESDCPGSEGVLVKTLQELNAGKRIRNYLGLNRRCASSPDLWVLLGREYNKVGRIAEARRCLQAAYRLDSSNPEVRLFEKELSGRR